MNLVLNKVWICNDCNSAFIFTDDVEIHKGRVSHYSYSAFDMETGQVDHFDSDSNWNKMKHLSDETKNSYR